MGFLTCFVFLFAFSASTIFSFFSLYFLLPCGQKRLNYLMRMRRGSNNRETPKGVPSSKNNRQLATCRPFRDSCMRTKPNSYRQCGYLLGSVYPQGSKTFSHAYGPRRIRGSGTCDCVATHASSFAFYPFRNWEPVELLQERCAVLMAWSSENEACSSILDFLHWLN